MPDSSILPQIILSIFNPDQSYNVNMKNPIKLGKIW
jgi:hypothetical protein